jgi:predicted amidohydrolase YtcJ
MGTGIFAGFETEAALIRSAFERADNPSRIMLMLLANAVPPDQDRVARIEDMRRRFAGPHLRVDRRVKLLADGAFFALNMRMNPPGFTDGHQGKWIIPPEYLTAEMRRYWDKDFSLHVHVNGDEGLDVVLGVIEDLPENRAQTITLYLAWIAANRLTLGGKVLAPAERLRLDKALRAVTIEAAQVIGMDATVGSIAAGKKADFAVLDRDPNAAGAKGLREIRVEGEVFERRFFAQA